MAGPSSNTGSFSVENLGRTFNSDANTASSKEGYSTGQARNSNNQSKFDQDALEPIKVVRPRYAYLSNADKADRGQRSTIKILNPAIKELKQKFKEGALAQIVNELTDDSVGGFQSFMVQNISCAYQEKAQIVQTFGDTSVTYYFGAAPVFFTISGLIFDDGSNNWFVKFCQAYQELLRGTRSAQRSEVLQINLPSCSIIGSIHSFQYSQEASRDTDIQFSIVVHAHHVDYFYVDTGEGVSVYGGNLTSPLEVDSSEIPTLSQSDINSIKESIPGLSEESASETAAVLSAIGSYSNTVAGIVRPINQLSANLIGIINGFGSTTTSIIGDFAEVGSNLLQNLLSPVNSVLNVVQSIAGTATGIISAIDDAFNTITDPINETIANFQQTERLVEGAIGTLTYFPESLSDRIARLLRGGHIDPSVPILHSASGEDDVAAILVSRNPLQPETMGRL